MLNSLGLIQPSAYRQEPYVTQKSSPDSASSQERALSMGFYPDSQIPSVSQTAQDGALKNSADQNKGGNKNLDSFECQTCKNRKYQDGSDDPGVSFKAPTKLSPEKAAASVRSHENEHVTREQAKARREDREVVSQSVSYHSAICPECGRVYISGGTTRTVTKGQVDKTYGLAGGEEKGRLLDQTA